MPLRRLRSWHWNLPPGSPPHRSRRSRTARWPSGSRPSTTCPSPRRRPPCGARLVHAALEQLFASARAERTLERGLACLADAHAALRADPEFLGLGPRRRGRAAPSSPRPSGWCATTSCSRTPPRSPHRHRAAPRGRARRPELIGIIDRLELDEDGGLVVTDYKTGPRPAERFEQGRLGGVHFYSLLCEELFGQRPAKVQLLHLARARGHHAVAHRAVDPWAAPQGGRRLWQAVERACEREDFRPRSRARCALVQLPGELPGVRRRPGPAPAEPRRPPPWRAPRSMRAS